LDLNPEQARDEALQRPAGEIVDADHVASVDGAEADSTGAAPTEYSELLQERDEIKDRWLRLAAEFDNYRKRSARDWQDQKQRAAAEVLLEMLELSDNLERALAAAEDASPLRKGVELTYQQLQAALKRFGVEPVEAAGSEFDPARHEALLMVDSQDVESHRVVDVVRRGYTLHGEVLRPARVTVAR
jgi:molecular chaperone GrpE